MENQRVNQNANPGEETAAAEPTFTYTYSAKEQEEVRRIREKYMKKEPDRLEQLRRLDRQATRKGSVWAMSLGILGALLLGTGMSLCMTNLAEILGLSQGFLMGILLGVPGLVLAVLAYPIYQKITRAEREKIAPEILRLTEELAAHK